MPPGTTDGISRVVTRNPRWQGHLTGFRPGRRRSLDLSTGISPFWIGRTAALAPLLATDAMSGMLRGTRMGHVGHYSG